MGGTLEERFQVSGAVAEVHASGAFSVKAPIYGLGSMATLNLPDTPHVLAAVAYPREARKTVHEP